MNGSRLINYFVKQMQLRLQSWQKFILFLICFFFSLEFDRIIRPNLFKSDKLFNIHFSLLPSYKGMFTSVMPILNGEKSTGVTLHKIDPGIDTGDIIEQIEFELNEIINSQELYCLYLHHGLTLFKSSFNRIRANTYACYPQPSTRSSYYSKSEINFANLPLNFSKTAFEDRKSVV